MTLATPACQFPRPVGMAHGMKPTIYHNPRCTKSRKTLELLLERGYEPTIIEYLKTPPSETEVLTLIRKLRGPPHEILRPKEGAYSRHGLSPQSTESEVAAAIASDPILLERPLVVVNDRAAIGRPPENVLSLF